MNQYKAALVYKLSINGLVSFEKRVLTISALNEKDAFQGLLIKAAQTLILLQKENNNWEYIGLSDFENISIAPLDAEMILTIDKLSDMDAFVNDIKQYVEALSNKIGLSA